MKKFFAFAAAALLSVSMFAANITVAEAVAIGQKLTAGAETKETYTVEGYVAKLYGKYYSDTKTQSFYMCDTKAEVNPDSKDFPFEAFKAKLEKAVTPGAKVTVTGKITNYISSNNVQTIEIKDGQGVILEEGDPEEEPETPELPAGVLSCTEAAQLASALTEPQAGKTTKGEEVEVWGYVTFAYDLKEGKQSFWLSDNSNTKKGTIQAAFIPMNEAVLVGDFVSVTGKVAKYKNKNNEVVLEITDGSAYIISEQGIENVVLTEQAQKVMVDGAIYIVRDGKMYNIQGARVR